MKVPVFVCALMALAYGSLEPAGYIPPGTYPQTRYLPPSAGHRRPDNRYVSQVTPSQYADEGFTSELSRNLAAPRQNEPVPFSQYLPANRQTSEGHNFITDESNNNSPRYPHSDDGQRTLNEAPTPRKEYLPPREVYTHTFSDDSATERNYLAPSAVQSRNFSSWNSASEHFSHKQDMSRQQRVKIDHFGSDKRSSGYNHLERDFDETFSGYHYNSVEDQTPAKYDFEYEVKDNYGNDYGHKETRNGELTQGVYRVLLPDGRMQVVHYEADSHGYRPTITYEEPSGAHTQSDYSVRSDGYHY